MNEDEILAEEIRQATIAGEETFRSLFQLRQIKAMREVVKGKQTRIEI
jgi:hypothetical protein